MTRKIDPDHEPATRVHELEPHGGPGRSTLTSRMPPSPASIARAVVAQLKGDAGAPALDGQAALAAAARGTEGSGGALPFLPQIQRAFGHHDVGGVRAHVGGAAAEASRELGAHAYAAGDAVAFAAEPDLHLAAHEAAHVVQQRAGVRLSGAVGQAGDEYERHADAVADRVVRGESAESMLDQYAHRGAQGGAAVQRRVHQVPWGTDALGDGSTITTRPVAEVWINGRLHGGARNAESGSATVEIPPGTSGVVRVRMRIGYDIEHTVSDDTGNTEATAGMYFTCDASGAITWGNTAINTSSAATRAFTPRASASASGRALHAVFDIDGPSGTGPSMSGGVGGRGVEGTVNSGSTTFPAGAIHREVTVTVAGSQAAAGERGGEGGGGNHASSESHANARAHGGDAEANSQSNPSVNSQSNPSVNSQSNPSVNTQANPNNANNNTVAPQIHNNIYINGQPQQQQQQSPQQQPALQQPQPRGGLVDRFQVNFGVDDDRLLDQGGQPAPLQRTQQWGEQFAAAHRQELDGGGLRVVVWGYASRTGSGTHNQGLSERRAAAVRHALMQAFSATAQVEWSTDGLSEDTSLSRDGVENTDDRRVEVVVTRRP